MSHGVTQRRRRRGFAAAGIVGLAVLFAAGATAQGDPDAPEQDPRERGPEPPPAAGQDETTQPGQESLAVQRSRQAGLGRTDISPELPAEQQAALGAMSMEAQQQRLDKLLGQVDVTQPPRRIDPETWAFLVPDDNEMTPERVALGRKLYFETRLSPDNTVSCATCHDVSRAFVDHRPTSVGIKEQLGQRNAPTVLNAAVLNSQFLDGRSPSLEEQSKLPIINPIEMGMPDDDTALAAIADDPEYVRMFQSAYGRAPNYDDLARAIAAFERTIVFLDSPFARFLDGDQDAISDQAKEGWVLYNGKARCVSCHPLNASNPVGSDGRFHNVGVSARTQNFEELAVRALKALEDDSGVEAVDRLAIETDMSELGRFLVTKDRADIGSFKTMQVTNAGVTAPYMHDGSMRTLWDVMDHYNKGGEANPFLDGGIEPLALTEDELDAVVAFLFTLTDDRYAELNEREMERQRQIAKVENNRPFRDEALANRERLLFEERVMGSNEAGRQGETAPQGEE